MSNDERQQHSSSAVSTAEIQISVRIRPILFPFHNDDQDGRSVVEVMPDGTVFVHGHRDEQFSYPSHVVKGSDQAAAFIALASTIIERVCMGYNCTLMAYGQTGSGKTYTMFGPPGCLTEAAVQQAGANSVPDAWGLFPRSILMLMQMEEIKFTLHASAIEIYHDLVFDLLDNKAPLQIGSTKPVGAQVKGQADIGGSGANKRAKNGVHPASCTCHSCFKLQEANKKAATEARMARVQQVAEAKYSKSRLSRLSSGPSSSSAKALDEQQIASNTDNFSTVGEKIVPLLNAEDVARFAREIEGTRTAKSHLLNDRSSRSHCLVKVHISSRERLESKACRQGDDELKSSSIITTLLFVDLAGSERIKRTGAEGSSMMEAQSINSSLSALGRVIRSLGAKGKTHVPYRDAALTMLLKDSFGGKSCTSVVINVAGELDHAEESICSLKFGERMSVVRNSPTIVIDSQNKSDQVHIMLNIATQELENMKLDGLSGGFVEGCIRSEKLSLMENMRKLEQFQNEVRACLNEIAEARCREESIAPIQQKLRICRPQAANLQAIVERQQTIKTLWAAPAAAYKRKVAEVKDLEGRMLVTLAMSEEI